MSVGTRLRCRDFPGLLATLSLLVVLPACNESSNPVAAGVTVVVWGAGFGQGSVASTTQEVGLSCSFPFDTDRCARSFTNVSGTTEIYLVATPATGSTFSHWTDCSAASETTCTLTVTTNSQDARFVVTAQFDIPGPAGALTVSNSTGSAALLALGGESRFASQSLDPGTTRDVEIPIEIGSEIFARAFVGGLQVADTECIVTAAAWQGDAHPQLIFSTDPALTCTGF